MKNSIDLSLYVSRGILETYYDNIERLLASMANDRKLISVLGVNSLLVEKASIVDDTNIAAVLDGGDEVGL